MKVRRLSTHAELLLLALVFLTSGVHLQLRRVEASTSIYPPQVSQSFVLSDFDADGLLDEARVEGSSRRKSVGILLSGACKRSFLHFDADRSIHGSLLARDIDNDGATDLIWANPLCASDAVVWLGDGRGRFVQVDSGEYGRGVASGDTDVTEPDGSNQETAITFESNSTLDQALSPKYLDRSAGPLPNDYPDRLAVSAPALGRPTDRAPPSLLS